VRNDGASSSDASDGKAVAKLSKVAPPGEMQLV
jgi:hypothetical protein